jgi:hypothetical protein
MKSYWTNNKLIDTLAAALGNRYAAIQYIMKFARHKADECDNVILHSSALVWIVTGSVPKDLKLRLNIKKYRLSKSLDTFLEYVTDDEIKEAVKYSVAQSVQAFNLTYEYNNIQEVSRQARVRILVRIILESLDQEVIYHGRN